jgi:glycosyltransferase involved in cell wall biosynthesis
LNNRFVFIIPFRNVKPFIKDCYNSILGQKYQNWIAIFCDDASTDDSISEIPKDNRFLIKRNEKRITALPNIHYAIIDSNLNYDDIICILDGDDALLNDSVLDILNNLYQDDTLLTYGQYCYPNGQIGHCKAYNEDDFLNLRTGGYWASHMRTFKYKLYLELIKQDSELSCYKDNFGNFYTITYDVAIMTPLMEIAGLKRIKFNPVPIYFYRIHQQNDHFVDPNLQKSVADEIFRKKKFTELC